MRGVLFPATADTHMKRRLLIPATVPSLLLSVTACAMGVRSYFVSEQVFGTPRAVFDRQDGGQRSWWVGSSRGRLVYCAAEFNGAMNPIRPTPAGYRRGEFVARPPPSGEGIVPKGLSRWAMPGVEYYNCPAQFIPAPPPSVTLPPGAFRGPVLPSGLRFLAFSWSIPATAFAALPALGIRRSWRRWRVARRVDRNACGGCGYNLTGNISGVCPECGAAAVAA